MVNNLIFGFHSVNPLVWQQAESIEVLYIDNKRNDKRATELIKIAEEKNILIELVSNKYLDNLIKSNKHQGVIAKLAEEMSKAKTYTLKGVLTDLEAKSNSTIVVLDGITDPHNFGAIIRTCDCFGVDAVIISKDNSVGVNATVAKVSSGAINNIPVVVVNNLVTALDDIKEHGYWIAGTTLNERSVSLFEFKPDNKMVWVMGSEGSGLRRLVAETCDHLVSIPMFGNTQSLNVSVAAGVVLSYSKYALHV
ncbi:MAG: 23S rRNA (guanosine(2251)-2'-O)-methyltransferase RlmB [Burkholderiales bacterium]|nr:23S rRNA (guanosine(2251)-2'-O)-methyltransferase RlmB [Burkholderiales bacterium]